MKSAVFLICLLGISHLEASKFRCDYTYYESARGWLKLHRTKDTWIEASRSCQLEGAELASPSADYLKAAILDLASSGRVDAIHTARITRNDSYSKTPEKVLTLGIQGTDLEVDSDERYPFICYKEADEDVWLNECGTVDDGYALDNRTGHCYKFHRTPSSWSESGRVCDAEGARLAIINSEEEAQVIREIWLENPWDTIHTPERQFESQAFIGVLKQGDVWKTLDGQTIQAAGYDKFFDREPNNAAGNENCISIARDGRFYDDPCRRQLAFICERDPTNSCESNAIIGTKPSHGDGISDRSSKHFLEDTDLKMPTERILIYRPRRLFIDRPRRPIPRNDVLPATQLSFYPRYGLMDI